MDHLVDQLVAKVEDACRQYHRLVLLAGPSGAGKTSALMALAQRIGAARVNINAELSQRLLDLTERQRALQLAGIVEEIVSVASERVVLLDNLELIFDAALKQDPLRLLQGLSRSRTIVAAWSGTCSDGKLLYAEPEHPEYRSFPTMGLCIVSVDTRLTEDMD